VFQLLYLTWIQACLLPSRSTDFDIQISGSIIDIFTKRSLIVYWMLAAVTWFQYFFSVFHFKTRMSKGRGCKLTVDYFCYVCGVYTSPKQVKHNVPGTKFCTVYTAYFGVLLEIRTNFGLPMCVVIAADLP
jgi:hypothetical protein